MTAGAGVLRGIALALLAALLTATGHVVGGGELPDLVLLVVLLPLLAGVAVGVTDRCTNTWRTMVTLAAGQVALHELMVVLAPEHSHAAAPGTVGGPATLAGHAVATLVITVLVRKADAAVAAVAAALRRVLSRLRFAVVADRTPRRTPVPTAQVPGVVPRVVAGPLVPRGPPVRC